MAVMMADRLRDADSSGGRYSPAVARRRLPAEGRVPADFGRLAGARRSDFFFAAAFTLTRGTGA